MIWGIIGAMPSEIALLKAQMVDAKEEIVSGLTYQSGKIRGKDVVLCCSEIGKVNAAMCAQTLALRYHVDYMINTGVAGCTCDNLNVLDIVLSQDLVFHDFDWEIMEDYHPHTSKFPGDPGLIALAQRALEQMPQRCPWLKGEYIPKNAYRFILFENRYMLIFQIVDHTVYADYVVDCRQDYGWLIR